jgi:hypothetical protein
VIEVEGFGYSAWMGGIMEVRLEKKAAPLSGIEPALTAIEKRLHREPQAWLTQLQSRPGSFTDLERDVHRAFQQMADQVIAGLLAEATARAEFTDAAQKK